MEKLPTFIRIIDRFPTISSATRARWAKDPLMPTPDLIAGRVPYFTPEKLNEFDRLRTERELARREALRKVTRMPPPPKGSRGRRRKARAEAIEQSTA